MAAALARRLHPSWEVRSAGLQADGGTPISEHALTVLTHRGVDSSEHRSTLLTAALVDWAERIIVMTAAHERRLLQLFPAGAGKVRRLAETDLADPFMGTLEDYEECAEAIEAALHGLD